MQSPTRRGAHSETRFEGVAAASIAAWVARAREPRLRVTCRSRAGAVAVARSGRLSPRMLVLALPALCLLLLLLALLDYAKDAGFLASRRSLAGRLVVVTGAAGGLGRALALEFARRGAVLALWDVRAEALRECVDWLVERGVAAAVIHAAVVDVADASAVAMAARQQHATLGPAHVVVSNAAVVNGERLLDASEARLRASFDVNMLSHVWVARSLVPQMAAAGAPSRDGGVFVTVGSLMAELPAARLADYCASKAAVLLLHECLRWELRHPPRSRERQGHDGGDSGDGAAGRGVHCLHVQSHMIDTPLFAGGKPGRFGWVRALLPPLQAATVAQRIVRAVETRRERIVVPYILKWLPPVLQLLPAVLRDLALDLAGAGCAMEGFVGGDRAGCLPTHSARPQQPRRRGRAARSPPPATRGTKGT